MRPSSRPFPAIPVFLCVEEVPPAGIDNGRMPWYTYFCSVRFPAVLVRMNDVW